MFKKILSLFFVFFFWILSVFASSEDIEFEIVPTDSTLIEDITFMDWEESVTWVLTYVKDTIFSLLALISIWVFLYVGFRLLMARWNPEEFKKSLQHFVYAIVGIALVSMAYVLVVFVSGLKF